MKFCNLHLYICIHFTVVIAFINGYCVKLATYIQNICTVVKLIAIAILTVGGIVKIIQGNDQSSVNFRPHFKINGRKGH